MNLVQVLFFIGIFYQGTQGTNSQNRCDQTTPNIFLTECVNCYQNAKIECPDEAQKLTPGQGLRGCRYFITVVGLQRPSRGCQHRCKLSGTQKKCCSGYWGQDCQDCPKSPNGAICSGRGSCDDGITGNGTCSCTGNYAGSVCETCSQAELYGPTCQSTCACVHGTCNSGINGDGACKCTNGYGGPTCDKVLAECSTVTCSPHASCVEVGGKVGCQCNNGYQGDGTTCTEVNPCVTGTNAPVCHQNASCVHTGPNISTCSCKSGFHGDGKWCEAIDPCQTDNGDCDTSSTVCIFDGPGKSHCLCKEGFSNLTSGSCAIKDVCNLYDSTTCDPMATCTTILRSDTITVNCSCPPGTLGIGLKCYRDLISEIENENTNGTYRNQLNKALQLFKLNYLDQLLKPESFTLFVPIDSAFSDNITNDATWKFIARSHIVAGTVSVDFTYSTAKTAYPLAGSRYPIRILKPFDHDTTDDDDSFFATVRMGDVASGRILVSGRWASNGIYYVTDTLLKPPIPDFPNLGQPNLLLLGEQSLEFQRYLLTLPEFTLFLAMTYDPLTKEELKYLTSESGAKKLVTILKYNVVARRMHTFSLISNNVIETASGQLIMNVSQSGKIVIGDAEILLTELPIPVQHINIIDHILVPDYVKPILDSNVCQVSKIESVQGLCGDCYSSLEDNCPEYAVPSDTRTETEACIYKTEITQGDGSTRLSVKRGCKGWCEQNTTQEECCKGFYGGSCLSCPGPVHNPCSGKGICSDGKNGNGACECFEGYSGDDCSNCTDTTKHGPNCDEDCTCLNGTCQHFIESEGGICAACHEGFRGKNCEFEAHVCGDVTCGRLEVCDVGDDGNETCVCHPGFRQDETTDGCVPINPCLSFMTPRPCHDNAHCLHTEPGEFECECIEHFAGDGLNCTPIDPCALAGRGGCSAKAFCYYTSPGMNTCECWKGYHGDGSSCEEIKACATNNGGCSVRATCANTGPGERSCTCIDGYEGDGVVCLGNIMQEITLNPGLSQIRQWMQQWNVVREVFSSMKSGFTCFLPNDAAWTTYMSNTDKQFWINEDRLPLLLKHHIVLSKLSANNLISKKNTYVESALPTAAIYFSNFTVDTVIKDAYTNTEEIYNLPTIGKVGEGSKILQADQPTLQEGIIHIIDSVLIPPRDSIDDYPPLWDLIQSPPFQLAPYTTFLMKLNTSYTAAELQGDSKPYTIFLVPDSVMPSWPSAESDTHLKYHIIPKQVIRSYDVENGRHFTTLAGEGYKVTITTSGKSLYVNGKKTSVRDYRTQHGILYGMKDSFLTPVKNYCNRVTSTLTKGKCLPCTYPNECEKGQTLFFARSPCMYRYELRGRIMTKFGCSNMCFKKSEELQCCDGFYGTGCEPCPGGIDNACNGAGECSDGIKGTGRCNCTDSKFGGLLCEQCAVGRFGKTCDSQCSCTNGTCSDGKQGDGTCSCLKGFKGVNCDSRVDPSDTCGGNCSTQANCVVIPPSTTGICVCVSGYAGDGKTCKPINKCTDQPNLCPENSNCRYDGPGSYTCVCDNGYEGDGSVCIEINMCLNDTTCDDNADCFHLGPNMMNCICKDNFEGDGKTCTAVNPCETDNGGCDIFAQCIQTSDPGENDCTCLNDHVGDGYSCIPTIYEYVRSSKDIEWYQSVNIPEDLKTVLSTHGPITAFLYKGDMTKILPYMPFLNSSEYIAKVFMNHIVPCSELVSLEDGDRLRTMNGNQLNITVKNKKYYINTIEILKQPSMQFANGRVFIIDSPLLPNINTGSGAPTTSAPNTNSIWSQLANVFNDTSKPMSSRIQYPDVLKTNTKVSHWFSLLLKHNLPDASTFMHADKVTMFFPSQEAVAGLQADTLSKLESDAEFFYKYARYHIVTGETYYPHDLIDALPIITMSSQSIHIMCSSSSNGDILLNGRTLITNFEVLPFQNKKVVMFTIDKVLHPPFLEEKCFTDKPTAPMATNCMYRCPVDKRLCGDGEVQSGIETCDYRLGQERITGCRPICLKPQNHTTCCSGHYGPTCSACPGGANHPCSDHGNCNQGYTGDGSCTCQSGFKGFACELCESGRFGVSCIACKCSANGVCNEGRHGDGTCACKNGWTGPTCDSKITATSKCSATCHPNAKCIAPGNCYCLPGYTGDGVQSCDKVNLDYCEVSNGGCDANAVCSRSQGKVQCLCNPGYKGDGFICEAVDPCSTYMKGACHKFADCLFEGFNRSRCQCQSGFVGDGKACTPVTVRTSCAVNNGGCSQNAVCYDKFNPGTQPTVSCGCKANYIGDGITCNGNILDVLSSRIEMRDFYQQILKQSAIYNFQSRLRTKQTTLFVPISLGSGRTLSYSQIQRHMLSGKKFFIRDLKNLKALIPNSRESLPVYAACGDKLFINGATVYPEDIIATNGVIHLVSAIFTRAIVSKDDLDCNTTINFTPASTTIPPTASSTSTISTILSTVSVANTKSTTTTSTLSSSTFSHSSVPSSSMQSNPPIIIDGGGGIPQATTNSSNQQTTAAIYQRIDKPQVRRRSGNNNGMKIGIAVLVVVFVIVVAGVIYWKKRRTMFVFRPLTGRTADSTDRINQPPNDESFVMGLENPTYDSTGFSSPQDDLKLKDSELDLGSSQPASSATNDGFNFESVGNN